jgi:nitroreductase
MNFADLVRARRSVRGFQQRPVAREHLLAVLEAGRLAPSACNLQPWRFVVVTERGELDRLAACYARDWFRTAPAAIVVCGDHDRSWKRGDGKDHADVDAAIAADHMTLAAAELGLGTCWICAFDPAVLRACLRLPASREPIVLLPIGYPDERAAAATRPPRKALEEVVQWGLEVDGVGD